MERSRRRATAIASSSPIADPIVVLDPADPTASPLGWHDDGSTSFTILRGNNVHAYSNRTDGPPVVEPDCDALLSCDFDFPVDLGAQAPNRAASPATSSPLLGTPRLVEIRRLGPWVTGGGERRSGWHRGESRLMDAACAHRPAIFTVGNDEPEVHVQPWEMIRDRRGPLVFQGVTIRRQQVKHLVGPLRRHSHHW